MPQLQPLQTARKALPVLAKQLPKLWPLLLESKTREQIGGLVRDLAGRSPRRQLAAKIQLTEALAQSLEEKAATDAEREQAAGWRTRAQKMQVRLDMPVAGVKARHQHRAQLRRDLAVVHEEMNRALSAETDG